MPVASDQAPVRLSMLELMVEPPYVGLTMPSMWSRSVSSVYMSVAGLGDALLLFLLFLRLFLVESGDESRPRLGEPSPAAEMVDKAGRAMPADVELEWPEWNSVGLL